jgi:hypothetical protein
MRPSDDHQNTVSALTTANVLLGLLAAVFLGAFIYAEFFYQPEFDPQAAARYTEVAKLRLAEHSDVILAEVGDVTAETAPVIGKALYDQSQEDYKLYLTALEREGNTYLANVEKVLVAEAQDQYGEFLRRHRQVLREEFPERASDENVERVLAEFDQTFDRLVERYYLDEFRSESQRTVALWKNVEPVELPRADEPSLEEQLADYTADWAILAASENSPAAADSAPADPTPAETGEALESAGSESATTGG